MGLTRCYKTIVVYIYLYSQRSLVDWSDFWHLEEPLGEKSSPKMGVSLPRTPMNHRAKFDAASFILAGEIRRPNCTNKHTHKINRKTTTDKSTLPIGMCR